MAGVRPVRLLCLRQCGQQLPRHVRGDPGALVDGQVRFRDADGGSQRPGRRVAGAERRAVTDRNQQQGENDEHRDGDEW